MRDVRGYLASRKQNAPGTRFSKFPVITRPVRLFCFPFQMGISKVYFQKFGNCTVKYSAKETKSTSLEVRTHPTFLETLISKYDIKPVKLPGLSRNGPMAVSSISKVCRRIFQTVSWARRKEAIISNLKVHWRRSISFLKTKTR